MESAEHSNPDEQIEIDQKSMIKYTIKAWEKTVDVQQHFNQIEMQIRNFAITMLTTVLGAAGYAYVEGEVGLAKGLVLLGISSWLAFFIMDRFWYHQFLRGASKNAVEAEKLLQKWGFQAFDLSDKIARENHLLIRQLPPKVLGFSAHGWLLSLIFGKQIGSRTKIGIFYIGIALAVAVFFVFIYLR